MSHPRQRSWGQPLTEAVVGSFIQKSFLSTIWVLSGPGQPRPHPCGLQICEDRETDASSVIMAVKGSGDLVLVSPDTFCDLGQGPSGGPPFPHMWPESHQPANLYGPFQPKNEHSVSSSPARGLTLAVGRVRDWSPESREALDRPPFADSSRQAECVLPGSQETCKPCSEDKLE